MTVLHGHGRVIGRWVVAILHDTINISEVKDRGGICNPRSYAERGSYRGRLPIRLIANCTRGGGLSRGCLLVCPCAYDSVQSLKNIMLSVQ